MPVCQHINEGLGDAYTMLMVATCGVGNENGDGDRRGTSMFCSVYFCVVWTFYLRIHSLGHNKEKIWQDQAQRNTQSLNPKNMEFRPQWCRKAGTLLERNVSPRQYLRIPLRAPQRASLWGIPGGNHDQCSPEATLSQQETVFCPIYSCGSVVSQTKEHS